MEKIIIGSDHAGFPMKEKLKKYLSGKGYPLDDAGTHSPEPCDYPKNAAIVARKIQQGEGRVGILVCGTGLGEAIVANKFRGIRATNCFSEYSAKMAREHNDANILCLGARILTLTNAKKIALTFLTSLPSTEERHQKRLRQISEIEKSACK